MFKWLHPYAKSQNAYQLCLTLTPWFGCFSLILLVVGTVWGLVFAPPDYQQGESFRIIYVHVPAAIMSMGVYAFMATAAFVALVWQIKMCEWFIVAVAPIGICYTLIALVTGAVWGKPMWGTWWQWDARLTSELILLFIYLGIVALYSAFEDKDIAGKATSILTLVGSVNLPVIHFSVEWWNTLHQGATITKFQKPSIDYLMGWPLYINLLGFMLLFAYVACIRMSTTIIFQEQRRAWVKHMLRAEGEGNAI